MERSYLLSSSEMKYCDRTTIEYYGMLSPVLMERAALCVAEEIEKRFTRGGNVLIAAGCGNNGGDGIAAGRILMQRGFSVDFVLIGDRDKCSPETDRQLAVLEKYGCPVQGKIEKKEYDIVVDALFGIGLSRDVEGLYAESIDIINRMKSFICSVDIPSGICADTGEVLKTAVKAGLTVSFAFEKLGHALYPGCLYAGELVVRDIGITRESFRGKMPSVYTFHGRVKDGLPERDGGGNKGTFGKVLVIAGSVNMSGACELCAKSVYRIGAGMVKVITPEENRKIIQTNVPEALVATYSADESYAGLSEDAAWADCIVAGPGIGKGEAAGSMIGQLLSETEKPLVLDADALNLLSESCGLKAMLKRRKGAVILTPHVAECARLYGCSPAEIKRGLLTKPKELAEMWNCVVVCKDARTVVASPLDSSVYLNTSGNDGMATAGSGDVLAGIIAGLLAQGAAPGQAAAMGVYIHGLAGDRAAADTGKYAVMAGDLTEQLKHISL